MDKSRDNVNPKYIFDVVIWNARCSQ